jgi:hypothetical protein
LAIVKPFFHQLQPGTCPGRQNSRGGATQNGLSSLTSLFIAPTGPPQTGFNSSNRDDRKEPNEHFNEDVQDTSKMSVMARPLLSSGDNS